MGSCIYSYPRSGRAVNRNGETDHYHLKLSFAVPLALKLQLKGRRTAVGSLRVNGRKTDWKNMDSAIGEPVMEINVPAAEAYDIKVVWKGKIFKKPALSASYATGDLIQLDFGQASVLGRASLIMVKLW